MPVVDSNNSGGDDDDRDDGPWAGSDSILADIYASHIQHVAMTWSCVLVASERVADIRQYLLLHSLMWSLWRLFIFVAEILVAVYWGQTFVGSNGPRSFTEKLVMGTAVLVAWLVGEMLGRCVKMGERYYYGGTYPSGTSMHYRLAREATKISREAALLKKQLIDPRPDVTIGTLQDIGRRMFRYDWMGKVPDGSTSVLPASITVNWLHASCGEVRQQR